MLCELEQVGEGKYHCPRCKKTRQGIAQLPYRVNCTAGELPHVQPKVPSAPKRAWNYAKALAKWTAAGNPERSQEEIAALLTICQACPKYNATHQACSLCGCNVNAQQKALVNKLAMATEACPAGHWQASV